LVGSRSDFSQQGFELGEDLLDWVEVRGYFGRKTSRAPTSRIALRTAFVIEDDDVAWLEGGDKKLLDIGAKASPLMGPSNR
jgi:hypothetical protein